jgi:hypothetical protein
VTRFALLLLVLPACAAGMLVGATTVTGAALATSAAQRKAGGCYAVCTADTLCNPRSGLCERAPPPEPGISPAAPGDVASKAPGADKKLPLLPPPLPVSGGPPQIVPAAEQNPPSH